MKSQAVTDSYNLAKSGKSSKRDRMVSSDITKDF